MKITKTPILDSDNQGIVGFEITLSGYFFNRNKAIDKQDKLANQEAELEYEINEKINSQDDSPKEKEALKTLQNHLKELTTEREEIEKEIEDAYNKVEEIDNNFDDNNPYNYVDCDSSSLSYATSLITDSSFAIKESEGFEATPPYVDITIKSFIASVNFYFSSSASFEDSHDNLLRFYTEHTLYGEVKKYGVSISCNNSEYYSFFSKLCEWVRMDGEVDYVDDDLGHWGNDKIFSIGQSLFTLDTCTIGPGKTSFRLHSNASINIKELYFTISFEESGDFNALIKIINGNKIVRKEEQLGFIIVKKAATLDELEKDIFTEKTPFKVIELFRKLNGPREKFIKAGNILIIANPEGAYDNEIAQLIIAQKIVQEIIEAVENEGVNSDFFLDNYATLSNFFSIASQGTGIAGTAGEVYFSKINKILNQIDQLYKSTYTGNAALGGEAYYLRRGVLFSELDTLLKSSFLRQTLNLPQDKKIKSALRLSSKSIVHHWKKSGITEIPGYVTHLKNASKLVKLMRNIGYVGIAFSAMNSANEIYRACSVGRTNECKQVKFKEIGKFTGGIAGAVKGSSLCVAMGISGPWSTVGCFIGLSIIGAEVGALLGESAGNILYSVTEKTNEHL